MYFETSFDSPQMAAVRSAVRHILKAHEPNPAVVLDRHWTIADANASISLFTQGVAEFLLQPPLNVLRLSLHPEGAAPRVVNLAQRRTPLLGRLRRQVDRTNDPQLIQLYTEYAR